MSGNLGVEKRDDKFGTFYIGPEVNIPISSIRYKVKFIMMGLFMITMNLYFLEGTTLGLN